MKKVVEMVNATGLNNTKGGPMTYTVVERMLKNRRYIGGLSYRDVRKPDATALILI